MEGLRIYIRGEEERRGEAVLIVINSYDQTTGGGVALALKR